MILQSLVQYYEALERQGKVTRPGWCLAKVSYALELGGEGELLRVLPLEQPQQQGKKTVMRPQMIRVPQMASRTSGVAANFLCDNSGFLLRIDKKGKPGRILECFQSTREKHLEILKDAKGAAARSVRSFFEKWRPESAGDAAALTEYLDEIQEGYNLIFLVNGRFAQEDEEIARLWEEYFHKGEEGEKGICLVTGRQDQVARTHRTVKGVAGAQTSGAALVSFNASSFESYEKEQSFNAPVGEYAVYAYTTALSYLLSDRKFNSLIGDTTVMYWSEDGGEGYQEAYNWFAEPTADNQEIVRDVFRRLEAGKAVNVPGVEESLNPDQRFYVLGLAPNAARLAVRFFYQDSFGNILRHLQEHYRRMEIVRPANDPVEYLGIWRMLMETVNKKSRDKKPASNMSGAVYQAVISGGRYPDALYYGVMQRIRAECDDKDSGIYKITRGRAAIIKAFLLRNTKVDKEEITMALNEECRNIAYTLGRQFAVLEAIQEDANPGINTTIKDRYFNAACATPASIFPVLFKLANSHMRKISQPGKVVFYEKLLGALQEKLEMPNAGGAYPRRLTLEEQGIFILGYYHQTQKRYEKKTKEDSEDGGNN